MQVEEVYQTLFRLTEQIALLTGGLKSVELSLIKVESYQSRITEDNFSTKRDIQNEVHNLKLTMESLITASSKVMESVDYMAEEIVKINIIEKEKCEKAKQFSNCKICEEKDKVIKDLKHVRQKLAIAVAFSIIIALVALGMNFEPIRALLGFIKN